MCYIDGKTFGSFIKNTWIGDSGASCNIRNDDTGLYEITKIEESIQSSSCNMLTTKKGKLCIDIHQVDDTEWVCTLWPVKFCPKAAANFFSLTCELMQGNEISGDHWNNTQVLPLKVRSLLAMEDSSNYTQSFF